MTKELAQLAIMKLKNPTTTYMTKTEISEVCSAIREQFIDKPKNAAWIESRVMWLRERYSDGDVSASKLTQIYNKKYGEDRTVSAVTSKLRGVHAKAYTKEQDDWIRANRDLSYDEMAFAFNDRFGTFRSEGALRSRVWILKKRITDKYGEDIGCTRR